MSSSNTPLSSDSALHCEAFDLPASRLVSEATRQALRRQTIIEQPASSDPSSSPQAGAPADTNPLEMFYRSEAYLKLRNQYPVDIVNEHINKVLVEVFTPSTGVADDKTSRVLINLHGGGFEAGARTNSHLESIPVAALGHIKVVSVDYRMYPEVTFPAATDDALAVYQALLSDYPPENIGIFGTSAGATLCAQLIVRLQDSGLPLPIAIAMIAAGATPLTGDSVAIGQSILGAQMPGFDLIEFLKLGYYQGADMNSHAVNPVFSDSHMAGFPPTFIASSTRDFLLSPVVATHRKLVQTGVENELHVWEGLDHFFHANVELPETEELHRLMLTFFDKHFAE